MKIKILFFATLRESTGVETMNLELATGSYSELRRVLTDELGGAADALWRENVRIAHNQALIADAPASLALCDGDEVAFLPPVTGG